MFVVFNEGHNGSRYCFSTKMFVDTSSGECRMENTGCCQRNSADIVVNPLGRAYTTNTNIIQNNCPVSAGELRHQPSIPVSYGSGDCHLPILGLVLQDRR